MRHKLRHLFSPKKIQARRRPNICKWFDGQEAGAQKLVKLLEHEDRVRVPKEPVRVWVRSDEYQHLVSQHVLLYYVWSAFATASLSATCSKVPR